MRSRKVTNYDKVIMALGSSGRESFSPSEVIVLAWRQDPQAFGLKEYEADYPDSNRVNVTIMGAKGLATSGMVDRHDDGRYFLTDQGKERARQLGAIQPQITEKINNHVLLTPVDNAFLVQVLSRDAVSLWHYGDKHRIDSNAALRFLGLPEGSRSAAMIQQRKASMNIRITAATQSLGDKLSVLSNGREVSKQDLLEVREVFEYIAALPLDRLGVV